MKTGVLLASAVVLCALATGCARVNVARNGCDSCGSKVGCADVPCTGVAGTGGAALGTGPAGVAATAASAASAAAAGSGAEECR